MHRLGQLVNGDWQAHSHPPIFKCGKRIVAGVPDSNPAFFERMVECMEPPFQLLYVLHTPRGEAAPGRYQSPSLSITQVKEFLVKFSKFFSSDGRYDLWAHSPSDGGTVVWDRHDLLFAYGQLDKFSSALTDLGFIEGRPSIPAPHEHYYRSELDHQARSVIDAFDWSYSPLKPEDEQ